MSTAIDQRSNLAQIEELNQRGGRLLTVVDLIEAGTLSLDLSAYLLSAVSGGASFLTAAVPGNAGKTTVLATLLTFLPPDARIVTVVDGRRLPQRPDGERTCYLVHEIGDGPFYSYLWGRDAARFLALRDGHSIVASCIHADTIDQMRAVLIDHLGVEEAVFSRIDLLLFMRLDRTPAGFRRRVAAVYESSYAEAHRLVWTWEPERDRHVQTSAPKLPQCSAARIDAARKFLLSMCRDHVRSVSEVRQRVVRFLAEEDTRAA
ncbi:MAG: hypothetical protein ACUVTZ_03810 [Armatimonadota bacterium]